ncbi:MAG: serine/threonine-protein phosphatase [Clostridia bacterium]|nr:serine/threonine-protein phosphatase [Clostridia bacterium]
MLFGVFDGMGGEERGEAAAYIAARAAAECEPTGNAESMLILCSDINREICAFTSAHRLSACGTTAAMLLIGPDSIAGCNIGDSRIYRCKGHILTQLSEDHVWPMYPGKKPPLLQFLGMPETEMIIEPFCFTKRTFRAGMYLICSDGLTDMVPDSTIEDLLSEKNSIPEKAKHLLDAALSAGGRDNVSFILLDIGSEPDP